jgi:GAF domain-containing protein
MQDYAFENEMTYDDLITRSKGLLSSSSDMIANMANLASLLYWTMDGINWIGFYLRRDDRLLLGPFHGKHACTYIPMGQGVCGIAAETKRTVIVPDVRRFEGHIVCDATTLSEIVVPVIYKSEVIAVLDVDSPMLDRFKSTDQYFFEDMVHRLVLSIGDSIPKW